MEWRALDGKPFAIIQRWHIADNADQDKNGRPIAKPMLAVTRLAPGPVCHVAYVDVKANPDANELARKAADDIARGFKCGKDKVMVVGTSGRAVELATMLVITRPGGRPARRAQHRVEQRSRRRCPSGNRRRMSVRRPSSSSVVKPCTSDQARAMAAA